MLQTFEISYAIRGDTGPARRAIVAAYDSVHAKDIIAANHMTAITNITFIATIAIHTPTIWTL